MKLYKSLFAAAALASGLLTTSCSSDGYWNGADTSADGAIYSFNASSANYTYTPNDEMGDVDVTITRNTTNGEVTLPLQVNISDSAMLDKVSIPETVTFANGQNQASATIKVTKQFEIGETVTIDYSIDADRYGLKQVSKPTNEPTLPVNATAADSTAYDKALEAYNDSLADYNTYVKKMANYKSATSVTIMKDYTWNSLGYGKLMDTFWDEENYYDVEIQQAQEKSTLFRLVDPYAEMMELSASDERTEYWEMELVNKGETFMGYTWADDNLVYFKPCNCGYYHSSYSSYIYNYHPVHFSKLQSDEVMAYDHVVSYQGNGLPAQINLAPYYYLLSYRAGWNYTTTEGCIQIIFPGVKINDYSVAVAYAGRRIDTEDNQSILADVELGDDVEYAKAAVVPGKDVEAAIQAVEDGSAEPITVTESGQIAIPFTYTESGKYTVIVVTYAEGESQNYDYSTFNYVGGGQVEETWTPEYVGTYTYTQFFGSEEEPYSDEGLVLSQSDQDPTRYKISHIFYDVDFIFTMADDGTISFEDQFTGYTHSSYGDVYVSDMYAAYPDSFNPSSYSNGTFTFAIGYYVSAGWFGYGYETYTLTGQAEVKGQRKVQSYFQKALKVSKVRPCKLTDFNMTHTPLK